MGKLLKEAKLPNREFSVLHAHKEAVDSLLRKQLGAKFGMLSLG